MSAEDSWTPSEVQALQKENLRQRQLVERLVSANFRLREELHHPSSPTTSLYPVRWTLHH